jgi:basic membrane lipoprotein Med (substrate-binding protein (PBP1-ABC) superfamily)
MIYRAWKPRFSTVIHSLCALSILACGGKERGAAGGPAEFRVGLLTTGPVSDQAWNAGAYRGLQGIRDSLGARISNVQTRTPAEIEENLRQYAAQGYDLVIGHGFEYQDPEMRVAPSYPKTAFVATSGDKTAANVAGIDFTFSDGAYLAGIVAGGTTRSNVLGVIGGTEIPPVVEAFKAFEAGAKSVNPKVTVVTSYVGNWEDASAAKEQALAQIARGADEIFQNADAAGLGVFQAARETKGVRVFGSNSDQNSVAPQSTLGSVVIDLPRAFLVIARDVKSGTFKGHIYHLGAKEGVVRWVANPALANEISPAIQARVDSAQKAILAGTLVTTGAK